MYAQILVAFLSVVALAGCLDDAEDLSSDTTTLAFEGVDSGTHEKTGECDGDGRLSGSGNIEDGRLQVKVLDNEGKAVFEKQYGSDFDFTSERVHGTGGDWTIQGDRQGDDVVGDEFKGDYEVTLVC